MNMATYYIHNIGGKIKSVLRVSSFLVVLHVLILNFGVLLTKNNVKFELALKLIVWNTSKNLKQTRAKFLSPITHTIWLLREVEVPFFTCLLSFKYSA